MTTTTMKTIQIVSVSQSNANSELGYKIFCFNCFSTICLHVAENATGSKVLSLTHGNHLNDESATIYDESKSREVSPKLVVRGKKYGRRSRPQSVAPFESSQSDSEEDYDFARVPTAAGKSKTYHKVSCNKNISILI